MDFIQYNRLPHLHDKSTFDALPYKCKILVYKFYMKKYLPFIKNKSDFLKVRKYILPDILVRRYVVSSNTLLEYKPSDDLTYFYLLKEVKEKLDGITK